jgi:RNA polymerase sigma-70 factor (ECF subfamily)
VRKFKNFLIGKIFVMTERHDVTQLLNKAQTGDKSALDELLPLVYNELRAIAGNQLRNERGDHTLQATALVHEAYMRLIEQRNVDWNNRLHFFSIAAEMMRRILVNYAVQRNAQKRGDGATKIALDDAVSFASEQERDFDLVALDDALKKLSEMDETQARIVELRFFGGLTIEETAEVLKISDSTVKREWRMAKAWLKTQL